MVKDNKLYDLLGVDPSVSETDLKKAYRKKVSCSLHRCACACGGDAGRRRGKQSWEIIHGEVFT